jgi:dTDP-4-dehydrorhamnose 3,5-epimerase
MLAAVTPGASGVAVRQQKAFRAMQVVATEIPAVRLIRPRVHGDARGAFAESFSAPRFDAHGLPERFLQDNLSRSASVGTVRGLHFQRPPYAQGKLITVVCGAILDVAVDLRPGSPSYGRHVAVRLSAEDWTQLYIPAGFAHGFCTLEPDTTVHYKATQVYAPDSEGGLLWNDPALGIDWPVAPAEAVLSDKDRRWPRLRDLALETVGEPRS